MRIMYDAVTAANISKASPTPHLVAGYIDKIKLEPWSAADWDRFPNIPKVQIVKKASTNAGHVLDVEIGDATPAEAPGWVKMRRAAGADPTVYMNAATWPAVRAAFAAAKVAPPHYWVAKYDGDPAWPKGWAELGCVAKQYLGDFQGIDKSSVADYWPGVDPATQHNSAGSGQLVQEDEMVILPAGVDVHESLFVKGKTEIYFCTADLGDTALMLTSVDFYGPTPQGPGGAGVGGPYRDFRIDAHRPGPLSIPSGAVMAQIRYTADHSFGVGVA